MIQVIVYSIHFCHSNDFQNFCCHTCLTFSIFLLLNLTERWKDLCACTLFIVCWYTGVCYRIILWFWGQKAARDFHFPSEHSLTFCRFILLLQARTQNVLLQFYPRLLLWEACAVVIHVLHPGEHIFLLLHFFCDKCFWCHLEVWLSRIPFWQHSVTISHATARFNWVTRACKLSCTFFG